MNTRSFWKTSETPATRSGWRSDCRAKLSVPFTVQGYEIVVNASVGIALSTPACAHAEDLLRDASIAMYRAKRAGKARCEVFDTAMHEGAVRRLELETELRKGLELGEFRTHYQPIVSLKTGRITGFEALTRWQHGDRLLCAGRIYRGGRRDRPDYPDEPDIAARGLRTAAFVACSISGRAAAEHERQHYLEGICAVPTWRRGLRRP